MRAGALDAGLIVKRGKREGGDPVEAWTEGLKKKWPSSILFEVES